MSGDRRTFAVRGGVAHITALTKDEHDMLVEIKGRPVTQGPVKRRTASAIDVGTHIAMDTPS